MELVFYRMRACELTKTLKIDVDFQLIDYPLQIINYCEFLNNQLIINYSR